MNQQQLFDYANKLIDSKPIPDLLLYHATADKPAYQKLWQHITTQSDHGKPQTQ